MLYVHNTQHQDNTKYDVDRSTLYFVAGELAAIELQSSVYSPGNYVLTISGVDIREQTAVVEVPLTIQGIIMKFQEVMLIVIKLHRNVFVVQQAPH